MGPSLRHGKHERRRRNHPQHIEVPTDTSTQAHCKLNYIDDCQLSKMSNETAGEDDASSIASRSSSTACNNSVGTIQLSLPDSFDDPVSLSLARDPHKCTWPKPRNQILHEQSENFYENELINREVELLRSKLTKAGKSISCLNGQLQSEKSKLCVKIDDAEYERLKHISKEDMSLSQFMSVTIHGHVSTAKRELDVKQRKIKSVIELAQQEAAEALQSKNLAKRREDVLREELEMVEQKYSLLEIKMKESREEMFAMKEKSRQYDAVIQRADNAESEVTKLQEIVKEQSSVIENSGEKEKCALQKALDAERKIQMLEMDKSYLQKESAIILERAERSERDNSKNEAALQEAMSRRDEIMAQLSQERGGTRAEYNAKFSLEIERIRDESSREIAAIKNKDSEVRERENRFLRDAREEVVNQLKKVRNELNEVRAELDSLILEKSTVTASLEKKIIELRSETKLKAIEHCNVIKINETLTTDLQASRGYTNMLKDQLLVAEKELRQNEFDHMIEKQRLADEVSNKTKQLEMYLQVELQVESAVQKGQNPGEAATLLSDPKRRLQQGITLARNCADLKKELVLAKKTNSDLKAKLGTSEDLLGNLSQPSIYIAESLRSKDDEIFRLQRVKRSIKGELTKAKKERDNAIQQLSKEIGRRQELDDIKSIVAKMKETDELFESDLQPDHNSTAGDGLLVHLVRHNGPGVKTGPSWHKKQVLRL